MTEADDPNSGAGAARFSAQVKVLAGKFLQRTAGQILLFEEQVARLAEGDRSVLPAIAEVAHKIHGSGAVFGFTALSDCAGSLEQQSGRMAALAGSAAADAHVQWSRELNRAVEQLARALHT